MIKDNYSPWEISIKNFPEQGDLSQQIKFLLKFALLAPSAHNSQPWQCQINSNTLNISVDQRRNLLHGDPTGRQLLLGLGCFLENLKIAADYFGFYTNIILSGASANKSIISVIFNRTQGTKDQPNHLINEIKKRHSDRSAYQRQSIPDSLIDELKNSTSNQRVKIQFIHGEKKDEVARISLNSQISAMESKGFREELSNFLKSNFTQDKFGMPGFTVNMPAIVSLFIPKVVKKINISKLSEKQELKIWNEDTPLIGIISVQKEGLNEWLEAGKTLERLWLKATQKNLHLSISAAAIENPEENLKIAKILVTNYFPAVIFRIGFGKINTRPSPRFSVENILLN